MRIALGILSLLAIFVGCMFCAHEQPHYLNEIKQDCDTLYQGCLKTKKGKNRYEYCEHQKSVCEENDSSTY